MKSSTQGGVGARADTVAWTRTLALTLAVGLGAGCAPSGGKPAATAAEPGATLRWEQVTVGDSLGSRGAAGGHARFVTSWPRIDSAANPAAADSIRAAIERMALAAGMLPETAPAETLVARYLQSYSDFRARFPDSALEWFVDRSVTVAFDSLGIVTLRGDEVRYDGGAHGMATVVLSSYDASTGRRLAITDLVREGALDSLTAAGEGAFRRARSLTPGASLTEEGFFRDHGGRFALSGNWGVTADGLVFHYNPYDVAPYAWGMTTVTLTPAELAPFVRPDGPLGGWSAAP